MRASTGRPRASDRLGTAAADRKSTRLNSSHSQISYAVFCLKKKRRFIGVSLLQATVALVATVMLITRAGMRVEGILVGRALGDLAVLALVLPPELHRFRPRF